MQGQVEVIRRRNSRVKVGFGRQCWKKKGSIRSLLKRQVLELRGEENPKKKKREEAKQKSKRF